MTFRAPRAPLCERIVGYPAGAPQTTAELVATEYEHLRKLDATAEEIEVVVDFRREVLETLRGMERTALTSPEVVLKELSNRRIRPFARRWLVYALDKERRRRIAPGGGGYAYHLGRNVPTAAQLREKLPLPENGTYLVIYGQAPDILSEDGVADEVARLLGEVPVADVLFWHLVTGEPGALYSLRRGQGDRGGQAVAFPDGEALQRARRQAVAERKVA